MIPDLVNLKPHIVQTHEISIWRRGGSLFVTMKSMDLLNMNVLFIRLLLVLGGSLNFTTTQCRIFCTRN